MPERIGGMKPRRPGWIPMYVKHNGRPLKSKDEVTAASRALDIPIRMWNDGTMEMFDVHISPKLLAKFKGKKTIHLRRGGYSAWMRFPDPI